MDPATSSEEAKRPRPSFKVVATLVKAANRFKNNFNVEYTPGKKGQHTTPAVQHRGAKAALLLGTVGEHEKNRSQKEINPHTHAPAVAVPGK